MPHAHPDPLQPVRRVFVSVGEPSGDLHASNLIRSLARRHPEIQFEGFGGPRMEEAGCRLHENIIHLASMGVSWVQNIFAFVALVRRVYKLLLDDPPDAFLLVDMPGFNFVLARLARWHQVPVVYYICPQIWAWAPWRRRKILKLTDLLMVIFPFEVDYYQDEDHQVVFVGHPLGDSLRAEPPPEELARNLCEELGIPADSRRIALFPGSRSHEVDSLVPYFRSILLKMDLDPDRDRILVSCFRAEFRDSLREALEDLPLPVHVVEGNSRAVMAACDLALVASGTATLELAYYLRPMLVLYRVANPLHHRVFRKVCTSPHIALVNILAGEEVVPEEIDYRDGSERQARLALELLDDTPRRRHCLEGLRRVRESIFEAGASEKAADTLAGFLTSRNASTGSDSP